MSADTYPDKPGFENRTTSFDAAQKVDAETLRKFVMHIHEQHLGLTDEELDRFRPDNCPTLRPRRCELTARGDLYDTGARRLSKRGRQMIVWGVLKF